MRTYVYTQAIVVADVAGDVSFGPESITFRHVVVRANDEDHAYSEGFAAIGDIADYLQAEGYRSPNTWFMNDDVVEVPSGV